MNGISCLGFGMRTSLPNKSSSIEMPQGTMPRGSMVLLARLLCGRYARFTNRTSAQRL